MRSDRIDLAPDNVRNSPDVIKEAIIQDFARIFNESDATSIDLVILNREDST